MLQIVEPFYRAITQARTETELHRVLHDLASHFGYRSAVLVDCSRAAIAEGMLLDTHPEREAWWRRADDHLIEIIHDRLMDRLLVEPVVVLTKAHIAGLTLHVRDLLAQFDMMEMTLVPMALGGPLAGCLGFSGTVELTPVQQTALQTICINLFVHSRFLQIGAPENARLH